MSTLDYDPARALALAQACYASYTYSVGSTVQSEAAKFGLAATAFECGPIAGFFAIASDHRVLCFEGTHSISGWIDDLNFPLIRHPRYPGRVHCGFAQGLDSVWDQVTALVAASDPKLPLDITGHSLGAALATLAQLQLHAAGIEARSAYTFGEPRVGDRDWADEFALPHWRVVDDCDPICCVPFDPPYEHVGKQAWYDRHGKLCLDPSVWRRTWNWIEEDLSRLIPGRWQLRVEQLASEHMIPAYLADLGWRPNSPPATAA